MARFTGGFSVQAERTKSNGQKKTEPDIIVEVRWQVPVAVGTASVPICIVPGAAAQQASFSRLALCQKDGTQ